MKDVIAQFQVNKANMNLRSVGGGKPKPQTGQKPSINEQAGTGNDTFKLPRKPKSDNQEGTGNSAAPEATQPFKVALKPVAKPPGVAARNSVNQKLATAGDKPVTSHNDETLETTPKASTSIANKSKMFETQKQPEVVTPSTPTVGVGTKPKFPANSNSPKSPVVPKPQTKPAPTNDTAQKPNGTTASSANKWKKVESKPDELKPTDQKPDVKKEFPHRKGVQDEAKTADDAETDDKVESTNFATVRPVKTTTKPSIPATSNTLPKPPKLTVASKVTKATKEPESEDDDQPKIPPKPSGKAEQPKIPAKTTEDSVQPKIPPRSSDKAEQPKIPARTAEDIDQPKIPLRREQKKPEESAADKTAPKAPPPVNRKAEENKPKKVPDVQDQNANKVGGKIAESLLRNMGRPLPKPAEKQYRLLPVPKQKGKPPRKMAKPPVVDLSKYATYATPKSVQPVVSQISVDAYEDGDDLYEDCDNMEVVTRQSSRISEYTEEDEAKIEKTAKLKPTTTNTDNYGKMFNAPSVDEYDDDEIYQEID